MQPLTVIHPIVTLPTRANALAVVLQLAGGYGFLLAIEALGVDLEENVDTHGEIGAGGADEPDRSSRWSA